MEGKLILTVAGSGDIPLHFAVNGARSVLALDISGAACALCSLKFAAVKKFDYRDFLWFFLAGIERAQLFLRERYVDTKFEASQWHRLYQRLLNYNPTLEGGEWTHRIAKGLHPFTGGLRPTELWFLHQISYLTKDTLFQAVKRCVDKITLVHAELKDYLQQERKVWDLIYLSNIPDYIRSGSLLADESWKWRSDLKSLFQSAVKNISSQGTICWYVFHDPDKVDECLEFCEEFLRTLRFQVTRKTIIYSCNSLPNSRFTNGVILASRER